MKKHHWKHYVAALLWPKYSELVNQFQWHAKVRHWFNAHTALPTFSDRFDLYQYVQKEFIGDSPIDFMEFGVFKGESLAEWLKIHRNPASRFFGLDSFEGLPEDWGLMKKGAFDVGGKAPEMEDPRVTFVKGWFQNSMPGFLKTYQPRSRLVIHNDSDLYSSTLYTLAKLESLIVPGTIVIFDEFSSGRHEYRAMTDFLAAFVRKARPIAVTNDPPGRAAFLFE